MARRNIFEILSEKMDIEYEIAKIEDLLDEYIWGSCTLEELIDNYWFLEWKQRGRCISCEEMRYRLHISNKEIKSIYKKLDKVLDYLEYLCNLLYLCERYYSEDEFEQEYFYLKENVYGLVEDLGYRMVVYDEEEKVILTEKNASTMAAAEIAPTEIAHDILEYNHYRLKGDIEQKRKILLSFADWFEPVRKEVKSVNSVLESNIGYMLNKMNIRHNNKVGRNASEYVANITPVELEEWYDETYQLLLLAMLELDNVERNRKINELKKIIDGQ